jgi:hypothetical protein
VIAVRTTRWAAASGYLCDAVRVRVVAVRIVPAADSEAGSRRIRRTNDAIRVSEYYQMI